MTEPRGRVPLFTRLTDRVIESPGTKPAVLAGRVAPTEATSMSSVPEVTVAFIGVLLSVKEPKVPMPATAAAAPMTPSEPTTLRAVGLAARSKILVLMSVSPCVRFVDRGFRQQGELWKACRRAPRAFRKESARNLGRSRRS